MILSPSHMHLCNVYFFCQTHTLSKYRTDIHLTRRLFSIADNANVDELWPIQSFLSVSVCMNRTSSRTLTMDIVGGQATIDGVGTDGVLQWCDEPSRL